MAREGDIFIPLFLLDQILSADFFSKNFQTFLEVKIYINRVILTPCPAHWALFLLSNVMPDRVKHWKKTFQSIFWSGIKVDKKIFKSFCTSQIQRHMLSFFLSQVFPKFVKNWVEITFCELISNKPHVGNDLQKPCIIPRYLK